MAQQPHSSKTPQLYVLFYGSSLHDSNDTTTPSNATQFLSSIAPLLACFPCTTMSQRFCDSTASRLYCPHNSTTNCPALRRNPSLTLRFEDHHRIPLKISSPLYRFLSKKLRFKSLHLLFLIS